MCWRIIGTLPGSKHNVLKHIVSFIAPRCLCANDPNWAHWPLVARAHLVQWDLWVKLCVLHSRRFSHSQYGEYCDMLRCYIAWHPVNPCNLEIGAFLCWICWKYETHWNTWKLWGPMSPMLCQLHCFFLHFPFLSFFSWLPHKGVWTNRSSMVSY